MDCPEYKVEPLGPHGGRQFRFRRYMICGCDVGICEDHAKRQHAANPFGPVATLGRPRRCRKHRRPA